MPGTLRVLWTIRTSTSVPKPVLRCSRCDQPRPFEPSGRFRLNANGKRLDAWLVYRCAECGDTWNRAIFERKRRSEIADTMFQSLQSNDLALADEVARDAVGLVRWATRLADDGNGALAIEKAILAGLPESAVRLAIRLSAPAASALRCDRVLAAGLGISRSRVAALATQGRITVGGSGGRPLARPLRDGALVTIEVAGLAGASALVDRAAGRGWTGTGPTPCD